MSRPIIIGTMIILLLGGTRSSVAQDVTTSSFSYQGQLIEAEEPANGTYSMSFTLWTDEFTGSSMGTYTDPNVVVTNGLFSAELDFGLALFDGTLYWLAVTVDGTPLTPRQPVTSAPYALAARGLVTPITLDANEPTDLVTITNTGAGGALAGATIGGWAVQGAHDPTGNYGRLGTPTAGVFGYSDVSVDDGYAVYGLSNSLEGAGVMGASEFTNTWGKLGMYSQGVRGETNAFFGVGVIGVYESTGAHGTLGTYDRGVAGYHGDDWDAWSGWFDGKGYFYGPVGIGTESPQAKLDVDGRIQCTQFTMTTTPTAGHVLTSDEYGWAHWAAPSGGGTWTQDANDIYYNSGNVGIGTDSPTSALHVESTGQRGIQAITTDGTYAVFGQAQGTTTAGVFGYSGGGRVGVQGQSGYGQGVYGMSQYGSGVYGYNLSTYTIAHLADPNYAVYGDQAGGTHAGYFDGKLRCTQLQVAENPTAGYVLTADAEGNASWAPSSGGSLWTPNGSDVYYNAGNVGIGTSAPQTKLEVRGVIQSYGSEPTLQLSDSNGGGSKPTIVFNNSDRLVLQGEDDGEEKFGFYSNFHYDRTNDASMQIYGKSSGTWGNYLSLTHDGTDGYIGTDTGNLLLDPAGNVGIGPTDPEAGLHVTHTGGVTSSYRVGIKGESHFTSTLPTPYYLRGLEGIATGDHVGTNIGVKGSAAGEATSYGVYGENTTSGYYGYLGGPDAGALISGPASDGSNGALVVYNSGYQMVLDNNDIDTSHSEPLRVQWHSPNPVWVRNTLAVCANSDGARTVIIEGNEEPDDGGQITLTRATGLPQIVLDAEAGGAGEGPCIHLYNAAGTQTIAIDGDKAGSGYGRVTASEIQITGGGDFSEQFDISSPNAKPAPGMVVCIDPEHAGNLILSSTAYDRKVVGVISGAGGIRPGLRMGQTGTPVDGEYPVALTGRVYVRIDTTAGSVQPGDLLTTSDTPGHAMAVRDHARAHGAIIGKAMSPIDPDTGLVLMLISLQ